MIKIRQEGRRYIIYDRKYDKFWRSNSPHSSNKSIEDYARTSPFGPEDLLWEVKSPLSVGFMITNECNARCLHCFASSGKREKDELSFEEIGGIVRQLHQNEVFRVDISGGEPLLRKDFPLVIDLLADKEISTIVSTNGYLIERYVSSLDNLTVLQISIDSTDPSKNDTFRGFQGLLTKVLSNLRMIKKTPIRIFSVLSKLNMEEIEQLSSLAYELGAQEHQYLRYIPFGRGKAMRKQFELSDGEYEQLIRRVGELKQEYRNKMIIECIDLSKNDCSYALIRPNGDLVTSSIDDFEYIRAGNLLERSLEQLWTSPPFNKIGHLKLWTDEGIF